MNYLSKQINRGIVSGYDAKTCTAIVIPYNGSGILRDVICPFSRYDPVNGAYSVTPPCIGSPCIYVEDGGETVILALYPPANFNTEGTENVVSPFSSTISRTPTEMQNKNTLPGNPSATTSLGAEETFTDSMKKLILSPGKLSSVWNLLNCVWENVCSIFKLYSSGADVECDVDTENNTNTRIRVRRTVSEKESVSVIDLNLGKNADIIKLLIDGVEYLHIDAERNTSITAKAVTLNATTITFNADELNCLNVGQVKLPK